MEWKRFDSTVPIHAEGPRLNPAGQRIQIIQAEGAHLIADIVSLKVEIFDDKLRKEETTVYGLLPNQTAWRYIQEEGFDEDGPDWSEGTHPAIKTLLRTAWFLSFEGPNGKRPIQMGRVSTGSDEASATVGIQHEDQSPVSRNSFSLNPRTNLIRSNDTGLFLRRGSLQDDMSNDCYDGQPLVRANSKVLRVKPGQEKSILQGLKDADLATLQSYYSGINGVIRHFDDLVTRRRPPAERSHWILAGGTTMIRS